MIWWTFDLSQHLGYFQDQNVVDLCVGLLHTFLQRQVQKVNTTSNSSINNSSSINRSDERGRAPLTSSPLSPKKRVPSSESSSVRDWEDPPPCPKCSGLNDRLLGEATKVNGLMRRIQEQQQEVRGGDYHVLVFVFA